MAWFFYQTFTSSSIWDLLNVQFWKKIVSSNVWIRYFVWNSKGSLRNVTQNVLPMHWKMCGLLRNENLWAPRLDLGARKFFWNVPEFRCYPLHTSEWCETGLPSSSAPYFVYRSLCKINILIDYGIFCQITHVISFSIDIVSTISYQKCYFSLYSLPYDDSVHGHPFRTTGLGFVKPSITGCPILPIHVIPKDPLVEYWIEWITTHASQIYISRVCNWLSLWCLVRGLTTGPIYVGHILETFITTGGL